MATYSREVIIRNFQGIHARPSAMIVNKANEFKTVNVFITFAKNPVVKIDPRSLLSLLTMGAPFKTKLIVFTDKEDMYTAVDAIVEVINSGFGEECPPAGTILE